MREQLLKDIANDESKSKKERIDELCRIDTFNHTDIGIESSPTEISVIKAEQKVINKLIEELEK